MPDPWTVETITVEKVAKTIDHSLLRPELTLDEVLAGCDLAAAYQVASVCCRPLDVGHCRDALEGSGVLVGTVVGTLSFKLLDARLVAGIVGLFTLSFLAQRLLFPPRPDSPHPPKWVGVLLAITSLIFVFGSYLVLPAPVLMGVAITFLEIFVSFLQAFIFAVLTSVFIGLVRHAH